jgi:hypothetical protein
LQSLPFATRTYLIDEIVEIGRSPADRGDLDEDETDPEFAGRLRRDDHVPGYAIFYIWFGPSLGAYVTSIEDADYSSFLIRH